VERSNEYASISASYDQAFTKRRAAAFELKNNQPGALERFRAAQAQIDAARSSATKLGSEKDTNYIFLNFVTHYLPRGVIGLALAVIFTAAISASSGEINSLATVSIIDIYRRHIKRDAADRHYLIASRTATAFWGLFAIAFASSARSFGALIETVNVVGSLFYGTMLGVFVLAFFVKRVNGTAAFIGVIAGQIAIFTVAWTTSIAWLWYNAVGCLVVLGVASLISLLSKPRSASPADSLPNPA